MTELLGHSPLGASGASRWMKCPGSVGLSYGVVDEESDHATMGTAAHALAANCLMMGKDAWEFTGWVIDPEDYMYDPATNRNPPEGITVGIGDAKDMADAVQVYLNAVRRKHPSRNQGNTWVERRFHCPTIHEQFYGTADLVHFNEAARILHVWDYKHGAGIVVEAKENPQTMYYAAGVLEDLGLWDAVDTVMLHIAQPRVGFHPDGMIRDWSVSTPNLIAWLEDVLVPAMDKAMASRETASGEHCRFCPARSRACPQLLKDADELEEMMKLLKDGTADELTNEQVGRFMDLMDSIKIAGTAASKTAFHRLNAGKVIPGRALAKAKANRVFKDEMAQPDGSTVKLADAVVAKFGDDAYTAPKLKSPAQIEELPEGEAFAALWAFKPDAGLTVVKDSDARPKVSKDTKSLFQAATKQRKKATA